MTIAVVLVGHTQAASAKQSSAAAKIRHSTNVLRFFENREWVLAPRKDDCKEVPWRKHCRIARALVKTHTARAATLKREMWLTIPNTGNWTRAIRYAQRAYPGTDDWLFAISGRECRACYTVPGGFVCNYQGSGACGPMQFMSGTFYGHADDARDNLAKRGFIVPREVWSWRNALGQALTAAYMRYTGQDNCHWCL